MKNRIHIMGASGSGASTLGNALAEVLPHGVLDGDDYFWIEKFTVRSEPKDRVRLLKRDLDSHRQWILSGAVCGWGDELKGLFDLVIFLHVPPEIRLKRLQERELERYGIAVLPDGERYGQSKAFLEWASLYDHAGPEVRSKVLHEQWMSDLKCPVLRLEGDLTVPERVDRVLDYLYKRE